MGMPGGRAWFHLQVTHDGDIAYDTDGAMAAKDQLADVVPKAVDQAGGDACIVLGFSQGAMLGHGLALQSDVALEGLAACSGRLVPEIFGDGPLHVPSGFPVFLSHGTLDEVIPIASGVAIATAYRARSDAHVTWIEEPIGHGIGPACLSGLRDWFASLQ
jgi:phospholipase/carboxylesterase